MCVANHWNLQISARMRHDLTDRLSNASRFRLARYTWLVRFMIARFRQASGRGSLGQALAAQHGHMRHSARQLYQSGDDGFMRGEHDCRDG